MNSLKLNSKTNTAVAHFATGSQFAPQPNFRRGSKISGNRTGSNKFAPAAISTALLSLSTALLASLPAHADVTEGQVELSPFIGYHMFDSDQNLEDRKTYGARLGYSFTPHWAIEGAVSRVNSGVEDASLVSNNEGQFTSPADDVDLTLYQVDALYHFRPDNKFSPYIVGGYGEADYSPSISDKNMSTFNVGAGVKYWVNDNLALRFDVRDHLVSEVFANSYHNISATVGVSFAFGGKAKSKPYQAAAPKPVKRAVAAEVIVLEFEDIHFDFDKATLTPEARSILQRSITTLQDNPKSKVRIAGYTSASGTAEHNQGLSERRATTIKNYLIEDGGISAKRLSVIGYGDTRPGSHEASPDKLNSVAAKENMRALFEIIVE